MKRAPLIDQTAHCVPTARRRGGAVAIGDDPFLTLEIEIRVVGLTIHHMVLVGSEGRVMGEIEAQRRHGLLLTRRWREMIRTRGPAAKGKASAARDGRARVNESGRASGAIGSSPDSPLEEGGFEPAVPRIDDDQDLWRR